MSEGLKQRIAGTIVLGVLGLILLPLLIDFADPTKIDRATKIPLAPSISAITLEKATRAGSLGGKSDFDPLFDINELVADDREGQPFGIGSDNLPSAWFLQVGSFVDTGKAIDLLSSLTDSGYKAFSENINIDGQTHMRVFIGPKIDRRRILVSKAKIDKEFGTKAILLKKPEIE